MKDSKDSRHGIHRRDFIKGGAVIGLGLENRI